MPGADALAQTGKRRHPTHTTNVHGADPLVRNVPPLSRFLRVYVFGRCKNRSGVTAQASALSALDCPELPENLIRAGHDQGWPHHAGQEPVGTQTFSNSYVFHIDDSSHASRGLMPSGVNSLRELTAACNTRFDRELQVG